MEADFGWDFATDSKNDDCTFTSEGDLAVVKGSELVAQDVRTAALASRGSLFYAPEFGEGLVDMLRSPGGDSVIQKLREAALGDKRVDWDTVQAGQYSDGKYYLQFSLLGEQGDKALLFDIEDILNG